MPEPMCQKPMSDHEIKEAMRELYHRHKTGKLPAFCPADGIKTFARRVAYWKARWAWYRAQVAYSVCAGKVKRVKEMQMVQPLLLGAQEGEEVRRCKMHYWKCLKAGFWSNPWEGEWKDGVTSLWERRCGERTEWDFERGFRRVWTVGEEEDVDFGPERDALGEVLESYVVLFRQLEAEEAAEAAMSNSFRRICRGLTGKSR